MDKLIEFSNLVKNFEKLSEKDSQRFVFLWNDFFGITLGLNIQSADEAYAICLADAE